MPVAVSAHASRSPTDTEKALPGRPITWTATVLPASTTSLPSSPSVFSPQHQTEPPAASAHSEASPTDTSVTVPGRPMIGPTGYPNPQHSTPPLTVTVQAVVPP